ncbi:unnamed protein product [Acanthosepion pharaonis]|uniref:Uncharacterized protein n=1 Tax=Acanthosepion pharaonis TaxID=158019 RepID=A0A812BWJ2_ACAPH|nr:unnamed protein product [Sepia pharaonis]
MFLQCLQCNSRRRVVQTRFVIWKYVELSDFRSARVPRLNVTRASDSRDDGRNDGHTLAKDSRPYEDQQLAPESRPDEICQTETCRTFRFFGSRTINTRVRHPDDGHFRSARVPRLNVTRASDSRDDGRNDGHTLAKDEDQQLAPEMFADGNMSQISPARVPAKHTRPTPRRRTFSLGSRINVTHASDSRDDGRNDGHTLAKDSRPYEDQQLAPESRQKRFSDGNMSNFQFSLGSRTITHASDSRDDGRNENSLSTAARTRTSNSHRRVVQTRLSDGNMSNFQIFARLAYHG